MCLPPPQPDGAQGSHLKLIKPKYRIMNYKNQRELGGGGRLAEPLLYDERNQHPKKSSRYNSERI